MQVQPTRTLLTFSLYREFKEWIEKQSNGYDIESMCQFGALLLVVVKKRVEPVEATPKVETRVALR